MLKVKVKDDAIRIGPRFSVTFQRTLRIPDDGKAYPLPPGLGRFPIRQIKDYADHVPQAWRARGGVFIPMYQREAVWLAFDGATWKPNAVQVGVGGVNAISGQPWREGLSSRPQNYVVCPDQLWLDGIHVGEGVIRQFVAVPLGKGYTIEGQLTGKEDVGGLHVRAFEPKPGRFSERAPKRDDAPEVMRSAGAASLGLGAGGQIQQKIYPDRYGLDTWDTGNTGEVFVHIVNSEQYRAITGEAPPPSPIDTQTYTAHGFPWFELYEEERGDVAVSRELSEVKSLGELERASGEGAPDESVEVKPKQVKKVERNAREGRAR